VVLERGRLGQTWRTRWESFCLVTPNWSVRLPGHPYDGDDPDGYMPRDEIVAYLERYAAGFGAPVREGIKVTSLAEAPAGGFLLQTSDGEIRAKSVVVATGSYRRAHRPDAAASLPAGLPQIDSGEYRSPAELPPGSVLVVGSGQSGCQIAEELHEAGREVFLACGRAPWLPRRIGGRDLMWVGARDRFFDQKVEELPTPATRLGSNVLRDRPQRAVTICTCGPSAPPASRSSAASSVPTGSEPGSPTTSARASPGATTATGRWSTASTSSSKSGALPAPALEEPAPFDSAAPQELDLSGLGVVVFAGG
jgi:putative flavoprotein involved in K+ transport